MLTRFAPLALVMVAACEPTPDYSACPIVGTWQFEWEGGSDGRRTREVFEDVFRADGTARTHGIEADRVWRPVECGPNRVVVEYPKYFFDGTSRMRTFEFEGTDVMREADDGKPRIWTRVTK